MNAQGAVNSGTTSTTECQNPVSTPGYRPTKVACGTWWGGRQLICDDCIEKYEVLYPQGWRGYPGDVCKHGVYVGGCGYDYMCFQCEMGDDEKMDSSG